VEVTEETFKQVVDRLPRLVIEWRSAKDEELVRIINNDTALDGSQSDQLQPENDRTQLELATTLFQCKICYTQISYPRILVHSCMRTLRHSYRDYDDPQSILWRNMVEEPWNLGGGRVGISGKGKLAARLVLESCGLDPGTTTANDMDDLDARFECLRCHNEIRGRSFMGWRAAVCYLCFNLDLC
jgi:hypothetical protein